jgi:hypothetical protein
MTRYYWIERLSADNSALIEAKKEELAKINQRHEKALELYVSEEIKNKTLIIGMIQKAETDKERAAKELEDLTRSNQDIIKQIKNLEVLIDGYRKIEIQETYTKEEVIANLARIVVRGSGESQTFL